MYKITDLKQIGKSDKYKVYLDFEYKFDLELEIIYKFHLKDGVVLDDEKLSEILYENQKSTCYSVALSYVSKSLKTEKQVVDYLQRKGYLDDLVFDAVKKLKEYKYVDDEQFARAYISTHEYSKGLKLLKRDLLLKGISDEIIESVFADKTENLQTLQELLKKKLKNVSLPLDVKQKEKIIRFLIYRGFDYSDIKTELNKYLIDEIGDL